MALLFSVLEKKVLPVRKCNWGKYGCCLKSTSYETERGYIPRHDCVLDTMDESSSSPCVVGRACKDTPRYKKGPFFCYLEELYGDYPDHSCNQELSWDEEVCCVRLAYRENGCKRPVLYHKCFLTPNQPSSQGFVPDEGMFSQVPRGYDKTYKKAPAF